MTMNTENKILPYQEKIILLMIRQEKLLAETYRFFAEKLPEEREFWGDMANEEEKHASWLKQLYEAAQKKTVIFKEGKVKTYTMETLVKGTEQKLNQARAQGVNAKQALAIAIDLERSLIEKDVFSRFEGMTEKARGVMKFLVAETKSHFDMVQKRYRNLIMPPSSGKEK